MRVKKKKKYAILSDAVGNRTRQL
ncbi:hypothetical protein L195_g015944, partial [Trifolium pratense]